MKATRPEKRLERGEYLSRARSMALRGQELPQTKLLDIDIVSIRSAARQRESLRKHIRDNLSNEALAKQYGVHIRTVEKCVQYHTGSHIP
jgi:hypothetical protein